MALVAPKASRCVMSIPVKGPARHMRCFSSYTDTSNSGPLEYRVKLADVGPKKTVHNEFVHAASSHALVDQCAAVMQKKCRIDALLSIQFPNVSRERIKSSIQSGNMSINSVVRTKPSFSCNVGDVVRFSIPTRPEIVAEPENIPLNVVHEDSDVMVVNKAAGMVVHPSPGHSGGTLVNAVLHHYSLPAVSLAAASISDQPALRDGDGDSVECDTANDDACEDGVQSLPHSSEGVIRPGIVHRLDKGTTGLMVVCRTDVAMLRLGEQFRQRTINRLYWSITIGVPENESGEVCTNIGRHPSDRLRMAVYGFGSSRGREAVSTYKVLHTIANGAAAVVQWKLRTGRTHQIRVHAQHIGRPLFGDSSYGGVHHAVSKIGRGNPTREKAIQSALEDLGRPALHARVLGFEHPTSGNTLHFDSDVPADLEGVVQKLDSLFDD